MDVERSSRAAVALRQSFNALFATVLVLSLFASVPVPEARLFSASLLAAYFLKTIVRIVNSEKRRDECWQIAREIGLAARVIVAVALTLGVLFAIAWYAAPEPP
jgi:hypothetical protein